MSVVGCDLSGPSATDTPRAAPGVARRAGRRAQARPLKPFVLWGVLFTLAVVLPLLRQRHARSWNTIWAEDGSIYLTQAKQGGGIHALFRSYAGYLQLPPRLLGATAGVLPLRQSAAFFAVSDVVVAALLAWFVYWASSGYVASRPVRLALASMIVLMPVLGMENTANATNTIWIFAAVAPWAFLAVSESRGGVAARSTVAFFASAATSLTFVYLPLALACALVRKARGTWIVAASFTVGLALQGLVALHATNTNRARIARSFSRLVGLTSLRVFGEYFVGDKGVGALWRDYRIALIVLAPIGFAVIFVVLVWGADRTSRVVSSVFVAYALVIFAVPIWGRGTDVITVSLYEHNALLAFRNPRLSGVLLPNPTGSPYYSIALRYSVIPVFLLASAIAVLVATGHRPNPAFERVASWLFVAQIVVITVIGFSVTNARSGGPTWSAAVAYVYNTECRGRSPDTMVKIATPTEIYPVFARCRDLR
jgi:hypothetical protein